MDDRLRGVLSPPSTVLRHRLTSPGTRNDERWLDGSRSIDHLVIAPSGVWVVIAGHDTGRVTSGRSGNGSPDRECLLVGGRDRSEFVGAASVAAREVGRSLDDAGFVSVPVRAVVCLVRAEWEWCAAPLHVGSVMVTWPSQLVDDVKQTHECSDETVQRVAAHVGAAFPARSAPVNDRSLVAGG